MIREPYLPIIKINLNIIETLLAGLRIWIKIRSIPVLFCQIHKSFSGSGSNPSFVKLYLLK